MVEEGADIIDLGAQSTRPNAELLAPDLELNRLMPVLQAIQQVRKLQLCTWVVFCIIKLSCDTMQTSGCSILGFTAYILPDPTL